MTTEIQQIKLEIRELKEQHKIISQKEREKEKIIEDFESEQEMQIHEDFLTMLTLVSNQKWHIRIKIVINDEIFLDTIVLIDTRANLTCTQEKLILTKYYEKTFFGNEWETFFLWSLLTFSLWRCLDWIIKFRNIWTIIYPLDIYSN